MAKGVTKKKNRKLRRQIRKTIGALLMVSAITVAAVPVPDISANPTVGSDKEPIKVAVTSTEGEVKPADATDGYASVVPYVKDAPTDKDKIIYTSGDGKFKFAFIRNVGAVLLDYQDSQSETTLTIPNQLEAYRSYANNYQDAAYYCLVSSNNELLGYKLQNEPLVDEATGQLKFMTSGREDLGITAEIEVLRNQVEPSGDKWIYKYNKREYKLDDDGNQTTEIITTPAECEAVQMYGDRYYPCFYNTRQTWEKFNDEDLYYLPIVNGADQYGDWEKAGANTDHWRIRADVAYVGAEKINTVNSGSGWELGAVRNAMGDGVFKNAFWIRDLKIEAVLRGVADYAFYDCSQLNRVEFKAGLESLGNGAFANCQALTEVIMPDCRAIGKDAFYNCTALRNIDMPSGTLTHLGDCAFEGCTSLESINFHRPGGEPVPLQKIGNHTFWGCTALASMEFPNGYFEENPLDIDMFYGCTSLQYIKAPDTDSGANIDFDTHHKDNGAYTRCTGNTWESFRNTVPESFYVEGPVRSDIHTTANNNSLTYKYPNEQLYEKVVYEHDAVKDKGNLDGRSAKVFYKVRVDGNNVGRLEEFGILNYDGTTGTENLSHPDIITIPEKVGTFGISAIEEGSFNNNCDLVKVTVPASVTSIGANAFKGCHELETVIFTDTTQIQSIGADAFRTQETLSGVCKHTLYPGTYGSDDDIPLSKKDECNPGDAVPKPKLYFVGTMLDANNNDTETFKYATNGTTSISHRNSDDIWITCHSGWPTNMEVQYNYDPGTQTGESQLVGYPRFEDLSGNTTAWATDLPYVTKSDDITYYANMIQRAIDYSRGIEVSPPITPEEQAFLAATLNPVIPASIDSIKPGLFSGYNSNGYQTDWEGYYRDEEGNIFDPKGQPAPSYDFKPIPTDTEIKTITINGVKEIEPYTFKNCIGLTEASIIGSEQVGDYAFEDCEQLARATVGGNLQDTGKRPFKGCKNLMEINCLAANFSYGNGILYRTTAEGKEIVECLENRGMTSGGTGSYNVGPDELSGVSSIKPEAFADCKDITQVDLSKTTIPYLMEGSFKNTAMNSIILPGALRRIEEGAFQNGEAKRLMVYFKGNGNVIIVEDAFAYLDEDGNQDPKKQQEVIFQCLEGTIPYDYAKDYDYIITRNDEVYQEYEVVFWNPIEFPSKDHAVPIEGSRQMVRSGEAAVAPDTEGLKCNNEELVFVGWDTDFSSVTKDLDIYATYGSPEYTVTFIDGFDGATLKTEKVKYGGSATPPTEEELPEHPGYIFMGWDKPHYNITADTTIVAKFVDGSGDINRFKVSFYLTDEDTDPWWETYASDGQVIMAPMPPAREGYTFVKWLWAPASSATGVKQDTSVYAQWTTGSGTNPNPSPSGGGTNPNPSPSGGGNGGNNGGNGSNGSPSPSTSPSASPTATPSSGSDVVKYTVSVSGGSGSGSYPAGTVVAINAYYMGEGQQFDKWTSSTAGVGFANPNASSTTFTMPATNVAVTATYKTGGSGSANTNTSGGGGGNGGGGNTVTGSASGNNGTVVDVTRPGISNTNVAGATVSGATDNFVVKVTEDQAATDAATGALQARFGDLSRIKYFPMDISLYDSTGRTKIADTSGISVNLTLPLPDELIQYAGNNKMAAISGGALEDLNARFTTVGGVPCINFTATHFSPYVLYVDTANLTEATIDATPKTGDPIHPKWFLALGMACISLILFFKRDKVAVKTKAA